MFVRSLFCFPFFTSLPSKGLPADFPSLPSRETLLAGWSNPDLLPWETPVPLACPSYSNLTFLPSLEREFSITSEAVPTMGVRVGRDPGLLGKGLRAATA